MARTASSSSTSRWSAAEVVGRAFGTTRRGYDPNEVRDFLEHLAAELEAAARREDELRAQLGAAEEAARHPVLDEAALSAALGQRIGAVLRNAHEEAARIAQEAEEGAAGALRDAQTHATEIRIGAESQAAARIAEAELEANALREHAKDEAMSVLAAARTEGEALNERAREHGRAMLDQAQEARRRVLADMAQRRRAMSEQIEQFRAARDEIAASVVGVRRSLDRIVDDLGRADDAARAAAAQAAHAHAGPPTERELVEEAERAAEELGVVTGAPDEETGALGPDPGAASQAGAPASPGQAAASPTAMPESPEQATGALASPGGASESPVVAEQATGALLDVGENTPSSALNVNDIATIVARPRVMPPEAPNAAAESPVPAPDLTEGVGAPRPGRGPESAPESEHDAVPDVEELFARLRARHAGDDAPAEERSGGAGSPATDEGASPETATAAPETATAAPETAASGAAVADGGVLGADATGTDATGTDATGTDGVTDPAEQRAGDTGAVHEPGNSQARAPALADAEPVPPAPDAAALATRDEALGPIVTAMARRLKRALQDDQNRLLDRLRQGTGEWSDALLADEAAQRALYTKAAGGGVRDSIAAGYELARSLAGGSHSKPAAPDRRTVDAIAEDLAATIVALLRRRLEGTEIPEAAERIGAAYREWRGERIERLAEDRAVEAFDAGVLAGAVRSKGLRWVRSETGPGCADCEDNALAGEVPPGDEFPTGHRYPPAHPGCRCLVVPTAS